MRFKQVGNKADIGAVVIKNAEASATIPLGAPVCLVLNGTNDGLGVVLPGTGASLATGGLYGVSLGSYAAGSYGEAQVFGFCNNIQLLVATRSDNSASFSTNSGALGLILCVDTVNNVFSTTGGTQAKSGFLPFAILAASFTAAGSASASTDTRTAATILAKAFLRMM